MNKNLQSIKSNIDLNFYIKNIKNIPLLSKDEEYILAKNFKKKNDINAAKKLVEANLNYVIKIAKNYTGYGIVIKDLIQEGVIGLIKAIKNFNPEKKIRLISFAIFWIKSEIHEYIVKNLRIVRIATTKTQKKLFFNLKKIKKLGWMNMEEKKIVSKLFDTEPGEIARMEAKLNKVDRSLDITDYEEKRNVNHHDIIFNENNSLLDVEKNNWNIYSINNLKRALKKLDKRSKRVLEERWLHKKKTTLKLLAKKYKISSERIRQIETDAIKKLKTLIKLEA